MAFESLSEKLSSAFKKLTGKGRLKEADVKEAMREVKLALLAKAGLANGFEFTLDTPDYDPHPIVADQPGR